MLLIRNGAASLVPDCQPVAHELVVGQALTEGTAFNGQLMAESICKISIKEYLRYFGLVVFIIGGFLFVPF